MTTQHIDVPPGRAAQSLWCDRNWHDGACCPGSIRQWHLDRDLLPPEPEPVSTKFHLARGRNEYTTVVVAYPACPMLHDTPGPIRALIGQGWRIIGHVDGQARQAPHDRGDHSACDRNCEHTL
jgi:hypothetical protein